MKKWMFAEGKNSLVILVVLAFVLLLPGASPAKERPGAMLRLEKEDGRIIRGELLEVQGESLIILDHEGLEKSSYRLEELKRIVIEKKSGLLKGLGLGLLIGGGGGAAIGLISGNDKQGFFAFTAGDKAILGGIAFGLLGGLSGAVLGALSGADESIDVRALSDTEKKKALDMLAAKARFPAKLTAEKKVQAEAGEQGARKEAEPAGDPGRLSIAPGVQTEKPSTSPKHSRFHISLNSGYIAAGGIQAFKNVIEEAGFAADEVYSAGFFSSTGGTRDYPRATKNPVFYLKDVRIEYSVTRSFSIGISYSPLGVYQVAGRTVIPERDYRPYFEVESYLNGKYTANLYFLSLSYEFLHESFLRRFNAKVGVGAGLCRLTGSFMTSLYELGTEADERDPFKRIDRVDFRQNGLCLVAFAEINHFFGRTFSLGISAEYKYVPGRTPQFQLQAPFWCYPAEPGQGGEMTYDSIVASAASRKFNAGGWGFGLSFGIHL